MVRTKLAIGLLGVAASAALWANDRPVVTLTGPGQGSTFQAPATITFTATASDRDGTVKEVRFLANGVKLASDYGAPYAWNWSGVPAGTYVLEARVLDNQNMQGVSNTITINVVAPPPPPAPGQDPTPGPTPNPTPTFTLVALQLDFSDTCRLPAKQKKRRPEAPH